MPTEKNWRRSDRHLLTAVAIRNAGAGRHRDGAGLFLDIDDNGRRWVLRVQADGRRREYGLGALPDVGLVEARTAAERYRADLRQGADPLAAKLARRAANRKAADDASVPTFQELAKVAHAQRSQAWKNGKHAAQWIKTLELYAFPKLGAMRVDVIGRREVLDVLTPIWHSKHETARRVRQRIEVILTMAQGLGHMTGVNPADQKLVNAALGGQRRNVKNHAALHYDKLPEFLAALHASSCDVATRLGFEFCIMTATRSGEARGAVWSEIDLTKCEWSIPAERMKSGVRHVVPLNTRALAILTEMRGLGLGGDLVFPDPHTGRAMSENRFINAVGSAGYAKGEVTPHGFRSTFKDWATACTGFKSEASERALAHHVKDGTEAAYSRDNLLEMRRDLMAAWGTFAAGGAGGNVVPLRVRTA